MIQRVKISVNEDGVVVWYPATIVDYGDDNPFKVIYDGYSEVYEFSTSEDDYRVLHDDQPLATILIKYVRRPKRPMLIQKVVVQMKEQDVEVVQNRTMNRTN